MIHVADISARRRALTDLDDTLLVEAAAGTGKTALMAARVTMLLAAGREPVNIAAITFTELAASELSARVHRYVDELLAGGVPEPLRAALPRGLDATRRATLSCAAVKLDELTATTIHGFCHALIQAYAVDADIDPGARILDAPRTMAAFGAVFEKWLTRRLTGPAPAGDPIVALSQQDPREVASTLQDLAEFRLKHRSARPVPGDLDGRPDIDLADAVDAFGRWAAQHPPERKTAEIVRELASLTEFYRKRFDAGADFARLWQLAHPPRLSCMRKKTFDLIRPRTKGAWEKAAGKESGARLSEEADALFMRVNDAYRTLLGQLATALVAMLSEELDEVLTDYRAFKRAAAVLDFEDLLERAHALVCRHDPVRQALGERYQHILVDEFQDTDAVQAEILFSIASDDRPPSWEASSPRPGALFLVGDPKQAIYKFRGAHLESYHRARAVIERHWPGNVLQITANFRSRPGILEHVNQCFAAPLAKDGQPGYVALSPTVPAPDSDLPCVAKVRVELPPQPLASDIRDGEAAAIAELCARLIGRLTVRGRDGVLARLAPGDVALLVPTGKDLWFYERALERQGLPVASQAGNGFFRRQEVQDLLALARTLADPHDTLAFGALMRGPLVGLTEEELLDITAALPDDPKRPDRIPRFCMLTDPAHIGHAAASGTLAILRDLRRHSRATTPELLLAEAIERLAIRPIIAAREGMRSVRALANLDLFLERAASYGVKGLRRFVRDIHREWEAHKACKEGRIEAEGDAIEVVTIHSSKGLEWPVVIPTNTATLLRSADPFVHRASDDTLHWVIGDVVPPDLQAALAADEKILARERERLLYVACTRARDLLLIPEIRAAASRSWARIVDLNFADLPYFDASGFTGAAAAATDDPPNQQTADLFAAEATRIRASATPVTWIRPSEHDADRLPVIDVAAPDAADVPEQDTPAGAGRVRGLIMHKLMEELLTGELAENRAGLAKRAEALLAELEVDPEGEAGRPDSRELASTVLKTVRLPEIASLRQFLIPELPVFATLGSELAYLAGRADAIALGPSLGLTVVDWKSDIRPSDQDVRFHAEQLRLYMEALGAPRGALVYMTSGSIRWIER